MEGISSYPVEYYRTEKSREHRWRITATNGRIIASSSEGYKNKSDMDNNIRSVSQSLVDHLNTNDTNGE